MGNITVLPLCRLLGIFNLGLRESGPGLFAESPWEAFQLEPKGPQRQTAGRCFAESPVLLHLLRRRPEPGPVTSIHTTARLKAAG